MDNNAYTFCWDFPNPAEIWQALPEYRCRATIQCSSDI